MGVRNADDHFAPPLEEQWQLVVQADKLHAFVYLCCGRLAFLAIRAAVAAVASARNSSNSNNDTAAAEYPPLLENLQTQLEAEAQE
eukprot:1033412-Alexandrium_andersonii.AAC.1